MSSLRESAGPHGLLRIIVLATLLASGCGESEQATTAMIPGERQPFSGNWSPNGTQQVLDLGAGRRAGVFRLSGSLMLTGKQRLARGFGTEVIGFSDTASGLIARSVWTDEHGDRVFSELRGEGIGPGRRIEGSIIGGTGRYAGIRGEYRFEWQRLTPIEGDELAGRVVGLQGWAQVDRSEAVSPMKTGGGK